MTEKKVSQRYARALYQLATENKNLDTIYQDMKMVGETLENSNELDLMFKSPLIKGSQKSSVVNEIFNSKINELTLKFINLLISKQRESFVLSILVQFEEIYNLNHGITKAKITTAVNVDDSIKEKLLNKITQFANKTVHPEFVVDESIKGGFKFLMDGIVYDQSISSKLGDIYAELTKN